MTNPTPTQSTKEMKNKHKIDDQSPSEKIARQEIKRLDDNLKAIKAIKSRISRIKPIECQKDMERVVEETKREVMKAVTTPEGIVNMAWILERLTGEKWDKDNNKQSKELLIKAINET